MELTTFRITVAYDGTAFGGWQVQPGATTVQGVLEAAAAALNGRPTRVSGAGRTDAGVHAHGQVARVDIDRSIDAERLPLALNAHLPEDVVVWRAEAVSPEFHPVRDAVAKHYRYTFHVARHADPRTRRFVHRVPHAPDLGRMRRAAAHLVGRRDFAAFQRSGSPRDTTVRTLARLDLTAAGDYIHVDLVGDGFLYGMARNVAGTLLRAGLSRLDPDSLPAALASGDRSAAGPLLPARGLTLMAVDYGHETGGDA